MLPGFGLFLLHYLSACLLLLFLPEIVCCFPLDLIAGVAVRVSHYNFFSLFALQVWSYLGGLADRWNSLLFSDIVVEASWI